MAFKLTKAQATEQATLVEQLEQAAATAADSITAYNEALSNAREFCSDIAETAQEAWNDKSEKWQESDKGQEVQGWIETWQEANLDDVEEPDFPHQNLADLMDSAV